MFAVLLPRGMALAGPGAHSSPPARRVVMLLPVKILAQTGCSMCVSLEER